MTASDVAQHQDQYVCPADGDEVRASESSCALTDSIASIGAKCHGRVQGPGGIEVARGQRARARAAACVFSYGFRG